MSRVNTIAHREVYHLIDCDYVQNAISQDVFITFTCDPSNSDPDDYGAAHNGWPCLVIQLNYTAITRMPPEAVRGWMLGLALSRMANRGLIL